MFGGGRVHLIGVGGAGMLPLAMLLRAAGHGVSGSDIADRPALIRLREADVRVEIGHGAGHVAGADCVVVSPAIAAGNPEMRAARQAGLTVLTRAEALAALVAGRETVCVAGSHGKSTTTALLAHILRRAGRRISYMVGAEAVDLPDAGCLGDAAAPFVMEACEAYGALGAWQPSHALITGADDEHAAHYGGPEGLQAAWHDFVVRVPVGGTLVVCGDDPGVARVLAGADRELITYGFGADCALRIMPDGDGFYLWRGAVALGRVALQLRGRHMMLNAAGAIAMALELGVPWAEAVEAVAGFRGVARRFQDIGERAGVRVIDDFAHHPVEITASLATAAGLVPAPQRRIVVAELQLPSRVMAMADAFAGSLAPADLVLLLPIFAGGETGGDAARARLIAALEAAGVRYTEVASVAGLGDAALGAVRPGDAVIVMAGGTSAHLAQAVMDVLPAVAAVSDASIVMGPSVGDVPPTLLHGWLAQVRRAPGALAARFGDDSLDYGEFAERAAGLAQGLIGAGVTRGAVVAVELGRSADRGVAFAGVMLAGGVFLPVDPALPPARKAFMMADAGAVYVLTEASWPVGEGDPAELTGALRPEDDAYLIYTSGSTGAPKAVRISHGALSHYAVAAVARYGIDAASRVSQVFGYGFDGNVGDMATALAAGACMVFATDAEARPGPGMARYVQRHCVSHLSLTPSALMTLSPADVGPSLRHIMAAGEVCPPSLVARWPDVAQFINGYGPTETTVVATAGLCRPGQAVTIGAPLPGVGICVLDEALRPVRVGETGELCVFGPCVGQGYLGRPELTAERFVVVDLPGVGRQRLYRSGDRARLRIDGQLLYLGRDDDQVKLRGYRIELEEIAQVLREVPGVEDACVRRWRSEVLGERLVAWVAGPPMVAARRWDAVREVLAARLPAWMMPDQFIRVAEIPLTANGKRDVSALPPPIERHVEPGRHLKTAVTETERRLEGIYRAVLGAEARFGIRQSLVELGVDSLQSANLMVAAEAEFGIALDIAMLDSVTIEILALHIDAVIAVPAVGPATGDGEIVRKQHGYLQTWEGARLTPGRLVISRNEQGRQPPLVWCCQGEAEHRELAARLGPDQPVHGLRSGHLVMSYTDANLDELARAYGDELEALQPSGAFRLGGNCQGGTVARRVALDLMRRGREVETLILMEAGRFPAYPGAVVLIFGRESHFNPFGVFGDPHPVFRAAYPGGYSLDLIEGGHGQYFRAPYSHGLGEVVAMRLGQVRNRGQVLANGV